MGGMGGMARQHKPCLLGTFVESKFIRCTHPPQPSCLSNGSRSLWPEQGTPCPATSDQGEGHRGKGLKFANTKKKLAAASGGGGGLRVMIQGGQGTWAGPRGRGSASTGVSPKNDSAKHAGVETQANHKTGCINRPPSRIQKRNTHRW